MNMDRNAAAGRGAFDSNTRFDAAADDARGAVGGFADQVTSAAQQGYGAAREAVSGAIDDLPETFAVAAERGRDLGRRADQYVRRELGDNGPLYVLAGAARAGRHRPAGVHAIAFDPCSRRRGRTTKPATKARKAPVKPRARRAKTTAA